jgi:hypothetical protein
MAAPILLEWCVSPLQMLAHLVHNGCWFIKRYGCPFSGGPFSLIIAPANL